ncbi:MAG: Ribonuclease R [Phycisphaerae bacterium]|nr:Ribonuclease R [Phycisphaerae bacterium]
MNIDELSERIIQTISESQYRPQKLRRLARLMGIGENEYGEYRDAVKALHRSGRLVVGSGNVVMPPEFSGRIVGNYRANPRGFGFVIPKSPTSHGDLFIPPGQQLDAVTGDLVQAEVMRKGQRGQRQVYEGRILAVLERGHSRFVGRLVKEGQDWLVWPDGRFLHVPIFVPDAGSKYLPPDTQVVVEIVEYPSSASNARGVIVEVLGQAGDPGVDLQGIIHQYHLPREFSPFCLEEASRSVQQYHPEGPFPDRRDLRDRTIVTIDPDDARDYDDAISIERVGEQWILGVHIADVSHFVTPDSALDREARLRGNSAYFPGYVIPMLPEVLSNGVCSLQEGVARLTKSVFIRYDDSGDVLEEQYANSVIASSKRLTYRQAMGILEGQTGGYASAVVDLVQEMDRLARIIQRRRIRQGMISLDLPKAELLLDEQGRIRDIQPEDQSFTHTIIEMFMVEANEAVARLLTKLGIPHLRRIHPEPEAQASQQNQKFLAALGLRINSLLDRHELQAVLRQVQGKPESFCVNLAILKSLQAAEYSPLLLGHFALASKHYSHFTSPIRRYPDLTVHRLLQSYLTGGLSSPTKILNQPSREQLIEIGDHCSYTERRAEDAERELELVKILQFLQKHLGEKFNGVVTGVTDFGVFIQLEKYLIEGLIRLDDLPHDWWQVVPEAGALIGERTGRKITLGDQVKVTLVDIDLPARQMDLHLLQHEPRRRPTGKLPVAKKKPGVKIKKKSREQKKQRRRKR